MLLALASQAQTRPAQEVAIATAFAPEFDALAPRMAQPRRTERNGVVFLSGRLAGVDVVLFKTGVSIVSATMTTQLAMDLFDIEEIIVSGIAGGVDPALHTGDVVIPDRWGKYDEMVFLRESDDPLSALPPRLAPTFEPFGFMGPRGVRIASAADPMPPQQFWYPADPALLAVARKAARSVTLAGCRGAEAATPRNCLEPAPRAVVGGNGVSGSIFLDNARFRHYLHATLDADVVEMETAAIAMVAHANAVRFIAFRSISDLAGADPEKNQMDTFLPLAAENAARFVEAYLNARPD
jgi:adenosylhomocysteine nucleosidase